VFADSGRQYQTGEKQLRKSLSQISPGIERLEGDEGWEELGVCVPGDCIGLI
jgi:hypothetical protein